MKLSIRRYESFEAIAPFCRAPGPTRHAFDFISYHRVAVIKAEQRIPTTAFEFALPCHVAVATFISLMAKTFEAEGNSKKPSDFGIWLDSKLSCTLSSRNAATSEKKTD